MVFKWMGNQIGNGSNVRFGSFVAKLVLFSASSLRDEGFSILACIVQNTFGSCKTDGFMEESGIVFFSFRNICDFYPAGYLC